jgi:integration host factor subunit alpha
VTKADIVQAVYTQLGGFSKKEAADLVDQVFDAMKETLGRGEKIKISGFGNFVLRDKRQRQGRNPQTGEPIVITARRVLSFKASQLLKQALNDDGTPASGQGGISAGGPGSNSSTAVDASASRQGEAMQPSIPQVAYPVGVGEHGRDGEVGSPEKSQS